MSDPVPTPPGVPPVPASLPARILRAGLTAALALALSVLGLLATATSLPVIRESLGPLVWEHQLGSGAKLALALTLLAALLVPCAALIFCRRRGWLRGPQLTALAAGLIAAFAWLTWDAPAVRRPLAMDELSPALPGDDASYHLVLRYAKNSAAANAFKPPASQMALASATGDIVRAPEKWATFLRAHRTEVEAGWTELAPVRAWWDELAAQPRLGDLGAADWSQPILAFQPVRAYAQYAVAFASLQALDGHGDEAFATVTNLYSVARKLEPNARTLVRAMIAKVIQKMALQTAAFVLDRGQVSPARRAALAAEMSLAVSGPPGARRLILIEYAFFGPTLESFVGGPPAPNDTGRQILHTILRGLSRVVLNPIATQNLVGDRYYALAALAEERKFGELEASKGPINRDFIGGYHVKNIGGRLYADMAMPAFSKVVKSYWDIDDLRLALLTRLKA